MQQRTIDSCWETVCALPVNTLITGKSGLTETALASALAGTPSNVRFWRANPDSDWIAPEIGSGTLVIDDADTLSFPAQRSLLHWMQMAEGRVRIVTLARHPLYHLVEQGRFRSD